MKPFPLRDILITIVLLIIAALPRVIMIDRIPLGIHGDEAWTAIDALKILNDGPIPAYSPSALGQPSGPAYLTALFFRIFGESVSSLRLSMAFFGTITIPLFYFFIKKLYGGLVSIIITLLFVFSLIHIHYSRIAFMLISAPFFVIGTLYFFSRFLTSKSIPSLLITAVFCGLGMYSYNSYILFPPLMFLAFFYLFLSGKISLRHFVGFIFAFAVSASLILSQIAADPKEYFSHHKTISVLNQAEFKAGNASEKLQFIYQNGLKKTKAFVIGHQHDGADGYGDFQGIDYIILVLATVGILVSIIKRNKYMLFLFVGLIIQTIPLFTTVDGYYRRVLIAYVFLYLFAAYALYEILKALRGKQRIIVVSVVSLFAVLQIGLNLRQYFLIFPSSSIAQFVFSPGVYVGLQFIDDDEPILLYSERYDCNYETFRFLLKGRTCIHYQDEFSITEDMNSFVKLYIDGSIPTGLKEERAIPLYDGGDTVVAVVSD